VAELKRTELTVRQGRAVLVGVILPRSTADPRDPLGELASLAKTAGAKVVANVIQRRQKPDSGTYIGSGKAEQIADLAKKNKADVVIYTISTNITRVESDGDKILRYYAGQTGGLAFFPFKAQDMAQSFENIANELRHQYNVLYRPEPLKADGLYHAVDIKVRNRKDLIVRARHGYYAPRM